MIYLDGFSGYGGFHLALENAGFRFDKCYFSEMDKHAIANYSYNYPNSIYAGLIQHINRTTVPHIDIFTFGWPCQDNSIAGKRRGQSEGTRSGLLYEAVRILNEYKPRHFIAENVTGLLSVNKGIDYIEAIRVLSDLGESLPQYDIEMQLCNTRWVLPQNRERLFFVGHLRGTGSRQIFPIGDGIGKVREAGYGEDIAGCVSTRNASGQCQFDGSTTLIKQVNPSTESGGKQPYQQNRIYDANGISPALNSQISDQHKVRISGWHENENIIAAHQGDEKRSTCSEHVYHKPEGILQNMTVAHPPKVLTQRGHGHIEQYDTNICPTIMGSSIGHNVFVNKIRRLTPTECERLQGLPDSWTKYGMYNERPKRADLLFRERNPELWAYHSKVVDPTNVSLREISDTQRYKLCGNGVSVPIVEMIAKKLYDLNYK